MTTTQTTAGTEFATLMLSNFRIGSRTRRTRDGMNMVREIVESVQHAVYLPGYYGEEKTRAFSAAFAAINGYEKHIVGYRSAPSVCAKVAAMSPRQFVLMIADMIDAGVSNMGQAETYFNSMR